MGYVICRHLQKVMQMVSMPKQKIPTVFAQDIAHRTIFLGLFSLVPAKGNVSNGEIPLFAGRALSSRRRASALQRI